MEKRQKNNLTVDEMIASLDKLLIEKGFKPTEPANKEGTFVQISVKSKNNLKQTNHKKNQTNKARV